MENKNNKFEIEILCGYTYQPLDSGKIIEIEYNGENIKYKLDGKEINTEISKE